MKELFEGRIVLIGTGAEGLRDLVATPLVDQKLGVEVHAEVIEQIVNGQYLNRPDWWPGVEFLLILILGVGIAFSLPRLPALWGGLIAVAGVAAVGAGSWVAFSSAHTLFDPVYLMLTIGGTWSVGTIVSFYREERARAYIRNAFDRYLSPELVARIARDPGQLELGGEERDMTVLFCDVRSFSSISEKLSPQEIIRFLIEFLTPMTDILLISKATVDKYIGDAIVAFWNAPLPDPDHPRNAALAALAMIERLEKLNAENKDDPSKVWPGVVRIGVGLNTGPCCVGNMGSAQRLSYSLIGDTVNLASRIEGLTKFYGVSIAIGSEMAGRIPDFALIEIDLVRVVGREAPERLFALMGSPEKAADPGLAELSAAWNAVLAAYRAQDWKGAEAALKVFGPHASTYGLEKLAGLYRERIGAFRESPPPAGWDGVFQATQK
jgi:adenylate cyclase